MKTVEFLKGWEKNFVTIFLEHNLFKNKKDEIDKFAKMLTLFSPFNGKFQFNIEENDKFFEELLSTNNYNIEIIRTGKKLFRKKKYKLVEINTNELLSFNLIKLAIQHKITLEFELKLDDQIKVTGILYGDAGESHSIHFDSQFFNTEEIKIKINNIFK